MTSLNPPTTTAATNVTNATEVDVEALVANMDQVFLVINGIFVLLMQPGFALLECGAVRSKNATNILVKNMLDALIAGVAYWLLGYGFAYGPGNSFIGYDYFAMTNLHEDKYAEWFFQYVFAATAATIVSGSMAERCNTTAYFTYSFVITAFIYPVVSHWAWTAEGWLLQGSGKDMHYMDFAGSGVVHLVGGVCALVGAIFLGPRIGRFNPTTGESNNLRGHSIPLSITGGMILLVGFLPFNGGSLGHITQAGDGATVARCVSNTTISGCFGGLVVLTLVRLGVLGRPRVLSALHAMNGALAGMVSICSGVNGMRTWAAAITGAIGGVVYLLVHVLVNKARIDDPLDAIAVHLGGGLWGLVASPLFNFKTGIVYFGSTKSAYGLAWNLAGALAITVWCGIFCVVMFGILKKANMLRVDPEIETRGLDIMKHNEPAYPAEAWFEEQYQNMHQKTARQNSVTPYDICLPPHMRTAKQSLDNIFATNITNGRKSVGNSNKAFVPDVEIPNHELSRDNITKL